MMSFVGIALESFAPVPAALTPCVSFTQEDVDRAYQAGFDAAEAQAKASTIQQLIAKMGAVADQVCATESAKEEQFMQAITAIAPLLRIILEVSQPASRVALLDTQITALFERLGARTDPPLVEILCPAEVKDFVTDCARAAGLEKITLTEAPAHITTIKIAGGEFRFCPDALRAELTTLINELTEDLTNGNQNPD